MNNRSIVTLVAVLIMILAASCTSSRPSYVLSSGKMEDVLYDIHKAHFLPEATDKSRDDGALQYALMLNVLKKHGVTQAEWDSSMVYYTRHADEMQNIYSDLMERLDVEASAMGASVSEGADTTDIWTADRHVLLMPNDLNTSYQWKMDCDTLLDKGEKVTLRFQAMFLNENGPRRGTAVFVMRLSNDSVVVRQQVLTQTAIYKLELEDVDARGIKSLSGLFILSSSSPTPFGANDSDSGMRAAEQILSITDIMLFHESTRKQEPSNDNNDSSSSKEKADTLPEPSSAPPLGNGRLRHEMRPL